MKTINLAISKLTSGYLITLNEEQKYACSNLDNLAEAVEMLFCATESVKVRFVSIPSDKRISVIKDIREITGLGLKESKEATDEPYGLIPYGFTNDSANALKNLVYEKGAIVKIEKILE